MARNSRNNNTAFVTKGRVEAFSDGVLAVAITLLVLDLHVETGGTESLAHQLADKWPSFAAYVVSFFVIGVIWVNHHALFSLLAKVDRPLLFYNLLLLMFVTTIPFTTATLAANLRGDIGDVRVAVLLYGISMEGMSISYRTILHRMVHRNLLLHPVDEETGRKAINRFGLGTLVYPVVVVIGLFSPVVMLVLYAALTGFYMAEQTAILPSAEDAEDPELEPD
ncbi:MAG TPA: TMEM175 family protein [Pseudonocardiaceae bacterium]